MTLRAIHDFPEGEYPLITCAECGVTYSRYHDHSAEQCASFAQQVKRILETGKAPINADDWRGWHGEGDDA